MNDLKAHNLLPAISEPQFKERMAKATCFVCAGKNWQWLQYEMRMGDHQRMSYWMGSYRKMSLELKLVCMDCATHYTVTVVR